MSINKRESYSRVLRLSDTHYPARTFPRSQHSYERKDGHGYIDSASDPDHDHTIIK